MRKRLLSALAIALTMWWTSVSMAQQLPVEVQFRMNVNYFAPAAAAEKKMDNLRRHLAIITKYKVKTDYWFTGLSFDQVNKLDPNFIPELVRLGIPIGHHGANRTPRPMPMDRIKGVNWHDDVQAIVDYESYKIDPETGELDRTQVGGLKKMQQALNGQVGCTGRYMFAPILYAEKLFGCRGMMGLWQNVGAVSGTAWYMGMLNMPEQELVEPQRMRAHIYGQEDVFKSLDKWVAGLDRTKPNNLCIVLHDNDFLAFRMGEPYIPDPEKELDFEKFWKVYEDLVKWAAENPNVKTVNYKDILAAVVDDRNREFLRAQVSAAADQIIASPDAPPAFIDLGNDSMSLADAFQAMSCSLATYAEFGTLPAYVGVKDILGPTQYKGSNVPEGKMPPMRKGEGPTAKKGEEPATKKSEGQPTAKKGEGPPPTGKIVTTPDPQKVDLKVDGPEIVELAKSLDLNSQVPNSVTVSGTEVHSAIFLQLMAKIFKNIEATGQPGSVALSGEVNVLPKSIQENRQSDALSKLQFWTYKLSRRK